MEVKRPTTRTGLQRGRRPSSAETPQPTVREKRGGGASTWPPTVVGGDRRDPRRTNRASPASTWPPTVVGGDPHASSRATTLSRCFNVAADRRRRRRRLVAAPVEAVEDASTWPPTVVGGDPLRSRPPGIGDHASTWPPTVVGGDGGHRVRRGCRHPGFNVAADRRRRRPSVLGAQPETTVWASTWPPTVVGGDLGERAEDDLAKRLLQRGRRPSSAETNAKTADAKGDRALQRGRRPSSAET